MSALTEEIAASLRSAGVADARAEAQALVAAARGADDPVARARDLARERVAGAPLAYLTGRVHFMGVELLAAPGALVPRAETELLARAAIEQLKSPGDAPRVVIDMCTGSGNLACALALALPNARVYASDLTEDCARVARSNVEHLGLGARVTVVQGDLFAALRGRDLEGGVDAIVCNPPYISEKRLTLDRAHLLLHEPREAFDGGPYGLSVHQRVIKDATEFLRPSGLLAFELGVGQRKQLELLFQRARRYATLGFVYDAAGEARVVLARFEGS